ncbi:hypothetical protein ACLEIY_11155 [Acetobacter tropicalis]|uniref:hypothetical protein n=1 Tax=Acetobacter tropicalis TaxID=104102 RepID=UPI00397582F8
MAIENGVVDATDPTLRGRLDALKVQQDEASRLCAMAEAPAMVVPVIIDEMIERFSHDLRAKLADGREIRIFGKKDRLMNQLVSDRPKLNPKVPSFGRDWRPVRDSNPCCRRERAISGG